MQLNSLVLVAALGLALSLPLPMDFPSVVRDWFGLHNFAPYVASAGAALAVAVFVLPTLFSIVKALVFRLRTKEVPHNTPLLLPLIVGAIPPMLAALAWPYMQPLPEWIHSSWSIAAGLVVSGLLLGFSDYVGLTLKRIEHFGITGGVALAFAHLLGFWPGASGIALAVAAARGLSLERPDALRVAVFTALPMLLVWGIMGWRNAILPPWPTEVGPQLIQHLVSLTLVGALSGLLGLMVASLWLRRGGLWPFALLQVAAGVAVLVL